MSGPVRPITRAQKLSTTQLLQRLAARGALLTGELKAVGFVGDDAAVADATARSGGHLTLITRLFSDASVWRDRQGRAMDQSGTPYRPTRLSAEIRAASIAAVESALAAVGATPAALAGNDLASVARFLLDSLLASGALRRERTTQFRDIVLSGLLEALTRRLVLPLVPNELLATVLARVASPGLRRLDGEVVTGQVLASQVFLLSLTKLGLGSAALEYADHAVVARITLADGTRWFVVLMGVEVKATGVVKKLAPQAAKHGPRLADLALTEDLTGVDQDGTPVRIRGTELLVTPDLHSIGLAPRGRWLSGDGGFSEKTTTARDGTVQRVRVYDAAIDDDLVRRVRQAVVDGWSDATRRAKARAVPPWTPSTNTPPDKP